MITIGVLGSRGKSAVAEAIRNVLKDHGKEVYIIGTSEDSSKEFVDLILDKIDYVIIEISKEDILTKRLDKIKFDVLIQTALEQESEKLIEEIQKLIGNIKENGYIIFNSDSIQKINFLCDKVYPITYGLNRKNTVTASSIDDIEGLCFSYCLQRAIFTMSNTIVQPFDKPVKVNGKSDNVYYYLAAFTCIIVLGFSF
jgi:UDP-N-acetylmuramyl tripeptide synthase